MKIETAFGVRAVFPVPSTIAADLPLRTSERAKGMLQAALNICDRRRPSVILGDVDVEKLEALVTDCRVLSAHHAEHGAVNHLLSEDEQTFDRFFGIGRCSSADAFAIGTAWGLIAMLHEIRRPHSLIPAELSDLVSGFYRLAESFLPAMSGPHEFVVNTGNKAPDPPLHQPPIVRWKNGHLSFVALTCGLIFAHVRAIAAIERRNAAEANTALRDASCLFSASAAAMHLAGDMTPDDYDEVRGLMSPPNMPEGFSGLFNADHRQMLNVTKKLGSLLHQEWKEIAWAREEYWRTLNDAYCAHRWVCQRLVKEAPSLATASRALEQPAPEKLEGFARRALLFSGFAKLTPDGLTPARRRTDLNSTNRERKDV